MTTRRSFIASLLAAGTAPGLGWAAVGSPAYLAAARDAGGGFALYGLAETGRRTFRVPLPGRGHAGAGHPTRAEAVAFARRPGDFALVIDCTTGAVLHRLAPPEGHHLNGHGVFADGGATLLTSEQESAGSAGRVGVWDVARGYARIGAFATGGLGPHDMRLMPDGETLVIANGGIATDPGDRRKLNLDTMRPSLTYASRDGVIRERVELDATLHRNSIRHLAVRADGLVGFAMQWQGDAGAAVPLLGLHREGSAPVLTEAPLADELAMQGYAGSVAFSGDGSELAITSPRGGRLHRFSESGAFLGVLRRPDISGLAPLGDGYLASDGLGGLLSIGPGDPDMLARHESAWDNHIVTLEPAGRLR